VSRVITEACINHPSTVYNSCAETFLTCIKLNKKKDGYRQRNVRQFLLSTYGTLFGYLTRVTPVCRCLHCLQPICGCSLLPSGIWLRQESLRHILASPVYAPGTMAVNATWMERGFNACQTHRNMYPSIFNRFPVIQPVNLKIRHFSTFLHILAFRGYAPGTIAVNVTRIEREFNAGQTPRSIYPSIFNHF